MALPEEYVTDELRLLQETALSIPFDELHQPTPEDLVLIGEFVQRYNSIELNLWRAFKVFSIAGHTEKSTRKPRTIGALTNALKEALSNVGSEIFADDCAAKLTEIEYRRSFRNLFAHWLCKRIPGCDALIFFSMNASDERQVQGEENNEVYMSHAVIKLPDIRGLLIHVAEYEYWLAKQVANWSKDFLPVA